MLRLIKVVTDFLERPTEACDITFLSDFSTRQLMLLTDCVETTRQLHGQLQMLVVQEADLSTQRIVFLTYWRPAACRRTCWLVVLLKLLTETEKLLVLIIQNHEQHCQCC